MGLGIAMLVSYIPFFWGVAVEIRTQWLEEHSTHPKPPHVPQPGEPHNTDGETR